MQNPSKHLETIGIVGMGLIGGSLGLSCQKLGYQVHGLTHKESTAIRAKERGLANIVSTNPKNLNKCSIIILALPIKELLQPEQKLINSLPKDAVITDVGSVKTPIIEVWKKLHPNFVPSHPMAGTNQTGVEAGIENLFHGKPWISTPDETTSLKAIKIIKNLAISLGCKWITADANSHDKAVALISHLPVLVSAALLKTAAQAKDEAIIKLAMSLSSSGFEDTTRVGGGNPQLGVSMVKNNTSTILEFLNSYQQSLKTLEEYIVSEEWDSIENELEQTNIIRCNFLKT